MEGDNDYQQWQHDQWNIMTINMRNMDMNNQT